MSNQRATTSHLPHCVIVRAPGLLPMLYRPREVAEDLGVSAYTVRQWIRRGAPHERDARKHIWINGTQLSDWIESQRQTKRATSMAQDEGYCFRCQSAVRMVAPTGCTAERKHLVHGTCPRCGGPVYRGVKNDKPSELPQG